MNISMSVILPIVLIEFILLVVALVDCIRTDTTNGPKWLWVILIIFVEILGPVLYFVFGRKNR